MYVSVSMVWLIIRTPAALVIFLSCTLSVEMWRISVFSASGAGQFLADVRLFYAIDVPVGMMWVFNDKVKTFMGKKQKKKIQKKKNK